MSADKQYADAKRALRVVEEQALKHADFLTYGYLAEALEYEADKYARHIGQVCSLTDATCYWMKLPLLSLEKIRLDDGTYNKDSFSGPWGVVRDQLISNSANRQWSSGDIARLIHALDAHMNGESALLQWKRIESFGQAAIDRALSYK
jgi:hypothetical protein